MTKFVRSIPYFKALVKAPSNTRMRLLKSFPTYVCDDMIEVLYNLVMGTVKANQRQLAKLKKHKNRLRAITIARSKNGKRKVLYKQNGGFLGILLPIVSSIVGGIIGAVRGK